MNGWIKDYRDRIETMNYKLEESIQKGSFDTDLDLGEILAILRGSINEINSLQSQVDVLKDHLKKLNTEKAKE